MRLVKTSIKNPSPENWKDVIPETENVLGISSGGGYFFATYMVDAIDQVKQFDQIRKIDQRDYTSRKRKCWWIWR